MGVIFLILLCPFSTKADNVLDPDINVWFMKSTFKIVGQNGKIGTVFILGGKPAGPGQSFLVLVTAAHVLEDMTGDWAILFLRRKQDDKFIKAPYKFQIRRNGQRLWVKNPNADVAAMFVALSDNYTDTRLIPPEDLVTDKMLEDYEFVPGREVRILGFPLGLESSPPGFPILRRGSIASYPLIPSRELKTFLVDFRVFEGNSGGPVYFQDTNWHKRRSGLIRAPVEVHMILGLVSKQITMTEAAKRFLRESKQKEVLSIAEVVHASLIRETLDLLPPVPTVGTIGLTLGGPLPLHQMSFLGAAVTRLQEALPKEEIERVRSEADAWEQVPTEENWEKASEAVTFSASKYSIRSEVTIVSLPQNGATIKYQTVGQRERREAPMTAKQITACMEIVPIGRYHIWSERDGRPTSDTDRIYELIKAEEKVEIQENASSQKSAK